MLSGAMIDGFGWFEESDYRRSWLSFDDVDYIFPVEVGGPIRYPSSLEDNPSFTVVRPRPDIATVLAAAARDAADERFRALVLQAPSRDLEYSHLIVLSDRTLPALAPAQAADPVFAVALLTNKLLAYAR